MAVDDPVRKYLARPTGRLDADRIEAGRHVNAAHLRRLAQEISVVGSEAFRPVEEHLHPCRLEYRHTAHGTRKQRLDMAEVRGQLIEGEVLGDAALGPGLRARLEPSDEKLAGVLLEVRAGIRVAQDRQPGGEAWNRLRDDVAVLGSVQRHADIRPTADLARPHAGAVHDDLRANLARLGGDTRYPAARGADRRDLDVLGDSSSALPRASGESLGRVDRVGLPVLGQEDRADQVIGREQRPALPGRAGRQDLYLEAEAARHGCAAFQLLEARL